MLADVAHLPTAARSGRRPGRYCGPSSSGPARSAGPCLAGTELEFLVFEGSYEQAWDRGYRNLIPANRYNADYSVLGTGRIEPLLRDIRNSMAGAGLTVESAKGECNLGQHEIAFRYADALTTADQHSIYKTGAKEIAAQARVRPDVHGQAERTGRQLMSYPPLVPTPPTGDAGDGGDGPYGLSPSRCSSIIAGLLDGLRELTLLFAPTINSYKRYADGSFAPTAVAWGPDNRTCALRLVGHGPSLRVECRVPGGDVNPYLAIAGPGRGRRCPGSTRSLQLPRAGHGKRVRGARDCRGCRRRWTRRWRCGSALGARRRGVRPGCGRALRDDGAGGDRRLPRRR